jgi:hypothetical protein
MIVQRLFSLFSVFVLVAGILFGSLAHATEVAGSPVPTAATAWLHPDGDADQVAADSDKAVPHHHNSCNGHDLAAPLATPGMTCPGFATSASHVAAPSALGDSPRFLTLRPPIA